ncbi:hypothetical protein D3C74_49970 [compost metagenome]
MKVSRQVKKSYKNMLLNSLEHDAKNWTRVDSAAADWSWSEFHSPQYRNIVFQVNRLDKGTCVFVSPTYGFSLSIFPLSKLWWARRKMIKLINTDINNRINQSIIDAIREAEEYE